MNLRNVLWNPKFPTICLCWNILKAYRLLGPDYSRYFSFGLNPYFLITKPVNILTNHCWWNSLGTDVCTCAGSFDMSDFLQFWFMMYCLMLMGVLFWFWHSDLPEYADFCNTPFIFHHLKTNKSSPWLFGKFGMHVFFTLLYLFVWDLYCELQN